MDTRQTNEGDAIAGQTLDDLGRIATSGTRTVVESPFKEKRPLVDADTQITPINELTDECQKNATKIAQYVVITMNSTQRIDQDTIKKASNKLFKEALYENVSMQIFMDAIATIPVNTDVVSALIGFFTNDYCDAVKKKIITELIPAAIAKAFKEDKFTTIKRFLHFLGFFVSYHLVTVESYAALLTSLANKLEEASDFRSEAICHVILFACRTAPEDLSDDEVETILDKLRPFVEILRPFISRYYPCKDSEGITELLLDHCTRFESHCKEYSELFERATPIELPEIELEFGPVDHAPPPTVFMKCLYTEVPDHFPVLLDMASDCLTFLAADPEALAHQFLAMPLVDGLPSLKSENSIFDATSHTPFLEAVFTVLFSDLLRVPSATRHLMFYVSTLTQIFKIRGEVRNVLQYEVEAIVNSFTSTEIASLSNLVKVLAHFTTNTKDHVLPFLLDNWIAAAELTTPDIRNVFIRSFIEHVGLYSTQGLPRYIPEPFLKYLPSDKQSSEESFDVKTFRQILETKIEDVHNYITELNAKSGEFETLKLFMSAVFMPAKSAEQATKEIEQYSLLIHDHFDFSLEESKWKAQVLVDACHNAFPTSPTILAQVLVYLITKAFIPLEPFLKWFFDPSSKERIGQSTHWDIFQNVMVSVFQYYMVNSLYDEMKAGMLQLFENALLLYKEGNDQLSEQFLLGNVRSFTLLYPTVFVACQGDINPDFYSKLRLELLCQ